MIIFNIVIGILAGDAPAAAPGHSGDSQIGKLDERTSPGQSFHKTNYQYFEGWSETDQLGSYSSGTQTTKVSR